MGTEPVFFSVIMIPWAAQIEADKTIIKKDTIRIAEIVVSLPESFICTLPCLSLKVGGYSIRYNFSIYVSSFHIRDYLI